MVIYAYYKQYSVSSVMNVMDISDGNKCFCAARTNLLFTQTLSQVTFGAGSHSLIFPHDVSPPERMLKGLNSMLPLDLFRVIDCKIVGVMTFHTRFTTHGKRYMYRVSRSWFYRSFQTFLDGTLQVSPWYQADRRSHARCRRNAWFFKFVASGSQTERSCRTIYRGYCQEKTKKTMKWSLNSTATAFCIIKCGSWSPTFAWDRQW